MTGMLALILGQMEVFEAIRSELRGDGQAAEQELMRLVLGGLGLMLLLALAPSLLKRRERPQKTVDYLKIAVDVLELGEQDRRDLLRIAARLRSEHPAAMLLSPRNLARAVEHPEVSRGDPKLRERMNQLCMRLFGAPLPETRPRPSGR